jgi:hypothetical protein
VTNAIDLAGEMGLVLEEKPPPEPIGPDGKPLPPGTSPDETNPESPDDSSNSDDKEQGAKNGSPKENLSAFGEVSFADILSRYPRVAIIGGANTGKTSLSVSVQDRPVIHSDAYIKRGDYRASAQLTLDAAAGRPSYVVEGVTAALAMRYGLEVDAVVHLTKAKAPLTKGQRSANKGTETIIKSAREGLGSIPVFGERGNGFTRKP